MEPVSRLVFLSFTDLSDTGADAATLTLSYYEREAVLTTEEADWKRRVFLCLRKKFMDDKQFHIVKELFSQVGNIDVFDRDVVNVLYNELVVALINNNEPHVTTEVVKIMDANSILVDSETTRALVRSSRIWSTSKATLLGWLRCGCLYRLLQNR